MAAKGIIVGAGRAGTHLHYGAHLAAGNEIVAYVDQQLPLAEEAATRFGVPAAYPSLTEALAKHPNVNFVDICTIASTHLPLAKEGLAAGCHVLVEKPLTETAAELEELREVVAQADRTVCAVHNHKYYPAMSKLLAMARGGELGRITSIHKEFMFAHERIRMMEEGHWAHNLPGGRLFEANPHNLYLLHALVGELELVEIHPRKGSERFPHAAIDQFVAVLRNDQATVTIRMSMDADTAVYGKHGTNTFMVCGTDRTVLADYGRVEQWAPAVRLLDRVKSKLLQREAAVSPPALTDRRGERINVGVGSGHYWLMQEFADFLGGKRPEPPVTIEEAYFTQQMNLEMGLAVDRLMAGSKGAV
ncbi:MAG: Gfo/Idh/MocA family oxidoreductase [Armatimonadetes bacterium]|nr:Gfo/Idh/MocA family oxidoreductase [Armatimonadota bacterium]